MCVDGMRDVWHDVRRRGIVWRCALYVIRCKYYVGILWAFRARWCNMRPRRLAWTGLAVGLFDVRV